MMVQQNREEIQEIFDIEIIEEILNTLLYVPDSTIKPQIIEVLIGYLKNQQISNRKSLKFFATKRKNWTGFVICQIEPEYKSYGRNCGSFGWLNAVSLSSCRSLMENCEKWVKDNGIKKIRGPINYPKRIGGCGFQVEGFKAPLLSGINFNFPGFREIGFLKSLNYKLDSSYACVKVIEQYWKKGKKLEGDYRLAYLTLKEHLKLKNEILSLADNSFHTILPDSIGGNTRFEEIMHSYANLSERLIDQKKMARIIGMNKNSAFNETWMSCDLEKIIPWAPVAFERRSGAIVGIIYSLPNLYQKWRNEPLSHCNVDTVMVRKEHSRKGIFSSLNNLGQLTISACGIDYIEGTGIWANNSRAIKAIFPHSERVRTHVVLQKRL